MGIIPQPSAVSPVNSWATYSPIIPSSVSPDFNVKEQQYGGRDGLINSMFLSVTEHRSGTLDKINSCLLLYAYKLLPTIRFRELVNISLKPLHPHSNQ